MVGVPGKSRGCHTCRRRKVKCDEGEPSCERCAKSGRECEGYAKGPVFLNRTAEGLKRRDHLEEVLPRGPDLERQSASSDHRESSQASDGHSGFGVFEQQASSQGSTSQDVSPTAISGSNISNVTSPEPMAPLRVTNLAVTRYTLRQAIVEDWFPVADIHTTPIGQWMVHTLELPEWGDLLVTSLLALTHSTVGKFRVDGEMIVSGRNFYGKALLMLQQALRDPVSSMSDETLAACQTMKFYEACESTEESVSSYDSHVHGIVRLVLYRGAKRNTSKLAKAVIRDIRYGALLTSIQSRRRNVIGGPEWRKDTWEEAADVGQALIDRGYDLAAVAEDADRSLSVAPTEVVIAHYLERVLAIGKDLKFWHSAASKYLHFSRRHWLDPLPTGLSGTNSPTDSSDTAPVDVHALRESLLMTEFWALNLALAVVIRSLRTKLVSGPPDVLAEADSWDLALQYRLGNLIMDQIPFTSRPAHGLPAATRCIFPTRTASHPARFNDTPEAALLLARVDATIDWLDKGRGIRHAAVVLDAGQHWGDTERRPKVQTPYETLAQPQIDPVQDVRLVRLG